MARRFTWISCECVSNASLSHGVGSGVPGVTRSFHLSDAGSWSAVTFISHGSTRSAAGQVGDVRRVVLVGQAREVVAELVDEDVGRPGAVGGHGRVEVEDASAAVGLPVGEDLDDVVGRAAATSRNARLSNVST